MEDDCTGRQGSQRTVALEEREEEEEEEEKKEKKNCFLLWTVSKF